MPPVIADAGPPPIYTRREWFTRSVATKINPSCLSSHCCLAFLAGGAARAADLVFGPSVAPEEVVAIQMKALRFNDNPSPDFGIAQTWNFAHPRTADDQPLPRC